MTRPGAVSAAMLCDSSNPSTLPPTLQVTCWPYCFYAGILTCLRARTAAAACDMVLMPYAETLKINLQKVSAAALSQGAPQVAALPRCHTWPSLIADSPLRINLKALRGREAVGARGAGAAAQHLCLKATDPERRPFAGVFRIGVSAYVCVCVCVYVRLPPRRAAFWCVGGVWGPESRKSREVWSISAEP
jgi:hypothetical protein